MSPASPRTASAGAAIAAASRGVAAPISIKAVEFQPSWNLLLDKGAGRLFREDAI
jgi:hypothetical protein